MRVAVTVLLAGALGGCGGSGGTKTSPALVPFPSVAPAGARIAAVATDAVAPGVAPTPDLAAGSIVNASGRLTVVLTLVSPLDTRPLPVGQGLVVGAYLLRSATDTAPYAARLALDRGHAPAFLWGPWLGRGTPAAGRIDGRRIEIRVDQVPVARFRYVQFFAEGPSSDDLIPDAAGGTAGVLPIR